MLDLYFRGQKERFATTISCRALVSLSLTAPPLKPPVTAYLTGPLSVTSHVRPAPINNQ
jgi:hypothetical protein